MHTAANRLGVAKIADFQSPDPDIDPAPRDPIPQGSEPRPINRGLLHLKHLSSLEDIPTIVKCRREATIFARSLTRQSGKMPSHSA